MDAVTGRVGALLVDRVGAVGSAQLVPAQAGRAWQRLDGLVRHQRLVLAEVPVGEPVHRPLAVGEDVQVLVRSDTRLREAVPCRRRAREDGVERRRRQLDRPGERRRRVRRPFHGQVVDVQRVHRRAVAGPVVLGPDDRSRCLADRPPVAVDVRREKAVSDVLEIDVRILRVEEELNDANLRLAVHHLVLLEGVDADPVPVDQAEVARRHQVRVRPDAVLRIIREVVAAVHVLLCDERVAVVRAHRVAARRDRDAVVEGGRRRRGVEPAGRELAQQPAVGRLVVEHDRVARGIGAVLDREAVSRRKMSIRGSGCSARHDP